MASEKTKKIIVFALIIIAMMAPVVVASMAGHSAWSTPWIYGAVTALIGVLMSMRLAAALSVVVGVAMMLGTLLSPYALTASIYLAVLTFLAAVTSRRGLHSAVLMVPMFTAFAVAAPTNLNMNYSDFGNALAIGLIAIAGGLWTIGVKRILIGRSALTHPKAALTTRAALAYAALTSVIVGLCSWGVLAWAPTHQGAWMIMTIIILMQPSPHDTTTKSLQRLAGTILGVLIAGVIAVFVPSTTVSLIFATVLIFAAIVIQFVYKHPYWQYVALLTPAIVLADSAGTDVPALAEDRLVFTALGVIVTIASAFIAKLVIDNVVSHEPNANQPA